MAKLIRQSDKISKEGFIEFIEFNNQNRGKNIHMKPEVGYACIVDGRKSTPTWQTMPITEVISETEFKTENNHYKIEL